MLVVGNGPSLNQTPLDQFTHVPSIGMNKIDMLFNRTNWRPDLIVTVNSMVVKQHAESFLASPIPCFISWKARWFAPRNIRSKLKYFYQSAFEAFSKDVVEGVGSSVTVTYVALQFAYYMGASRVIVLGVDHSFSKSSKAHSYETRKGPDNDHFDPNYFKAGTIWGIPNLDESERAYALARCAFEKDGREILDATVGGKLQIFKKISIEEALAFCNEKQDFLKYP